MRQDAQSNSSQQGGAAMLTTKSIRLTEEEAAELREYLDISGEIEAVALKRAAIRGIRELRLAEAIRVYLDERDTEHSARIAGLPRAQFLHVLTEKGITVLDGPSSLAAELEGLARRLGDQRLARVAAELEPLGA
jgi:predicted HTH domain antitoxin